MVIRSTSSSVRYSLLLTFLICVCVISGASAQTAPGSAEGFNALLRGTDIVVVDDSGRETNGELLRFTSENLTLAVKGREIAFDRQRVAAVYKRTNGVKMGMILGLLSGPALLSAALIGGDSIHNPYLVEGAVIFSAIGFGVGTAIDAMIPGKRLIYEKPKPAGAAAILIVPTIARSGASLTLGVSW